MDFIVDKPWGMHVLMAVLASALWIIVWTTMWLGGRFDKIIGKGLPLLLIGFIPCIPFGAIVLGLSFILGLVVAVMWMANMAFGWFDYQIMSIKLVFTKVASTEENGEDTVSPRKKSAKQKKRK